LNQPYSPHANLHKKGLIIGFDPGLTAGIAIMDLKGNILSVKSFKEISRAEIIKHIISFGKAVLISTDVSPPPKMVKKLATTLNAKLHHPTKDMSVGSKMELVESYLGGSDRSKVLSSEEVPHDAHQRDALAAAIRTYKSYQKKLKNIENRSNELNLSPEQMESAKKIFIQGTAISSALKMVQEMNNPTDEHSQRYGDDRESGEESENITELDETILKLKNKVKMQNNQILHLKNKNNSLKQEINRFEYETDKLQDKIDKLHYQYTQDILYQKELTSKISLIKKLQDKYQEEKALRHQLEENLQSLDNIQMINPTENALPVKIIENFTRDGIKEACDYWKIKRGDVVLLKSAEGGGSQTAALLVQMGVKAVLIQDKISHQAQEELEKNMVPLLQAKDMKVEMIHQFAIIDAIHLEKEIGKCKKKIINMKIQESNEEILKVFDEYRAHRKRSV
jgi:uncharacterized protein